MGKVEKLGVETALKVFKMNFAEAMIEMEYTGKYKAFLTALKNDEDQEDFFKGFWETWGLCNALCVRVVK